MPTQAATTRDNLVKILASEIAEQTRLLEKMRDVQSSLQSVDVSASEAQAQIVAIAHGLYAGLERSI